MSETVLIIKFRLFEVDPILGFEGRDVTARILQCHTCSTPSRNKCERFMRGLRSENGFSLLEFMVTVCIASILAAIGIPQYLALQRTFAHQTAVKEIEFAVRRARAEGLAHGGRAILATQNSGERYIIGIDSAPFSSTNTPDYLLVTKDLASGTSLTLADELVFDSRGFLIDSAGDPSNATLTFYADETLFCSGTVFPTAVMQFDCTSGG